MRIDVKQINRNRAVMEDSTIDSPYVAHFQDCDADFPERLYDNLPGDHVGFMPPTEGETEEEE